MTTTPRWPRRHSARLDFFTFEWFQATHLNFRVLHCVLSFFLFGGDNFWRFLANFWRMNAHDGAAVIL
jgi:hypothetical protein